MNNVFIKKEQLNSWIAKHFNKDLISIDDLISVIEELNSEIDSLKEEIEDTKQDMEDNYTRDSISSQVGIHDSDFI